MSRDITLKHEFKSAKSNRSLPSLARSSQTVRGKTSLRFGAHWATNRQESSIEFHGCFSVMGRFRSIVVHAILPLQ